jgi:peptide/nickel transport system substrate-binding protein
MTVTVLGPRLGYFGQQARETRATLERIGYRAKLRLLDLDAFFDELNAPGSRPQIGPVWFIADWPAASNFLTVLFTCPGVGCDPFGRRLVDRARRLDVEGRPSDTAWARVDRRATDLAGVIPLTNSTFVDLVSRRVGNYQSSPQGWVLLDQLWVR